MSKNIEMQHMTSSGYEILYPKSVDKNIEID
jgi:hypothetical protein